MKKYKNKDGVQLNFLGNDTLTILVKEVVSEALTMLEDIKDPPVGVKDTLFFLKTNFDIENES